MDAWEIFILSEFSAAIALAVLFFAALGAIKTRLRSPIRTADKGLEAIGLLFLTLVAASLLLIPHQSFDLIGVEEAAVASAILVAIIPLQLNYLREIPNGAYRRVSLVFWANRGAIATIGAAGLMLRITNHPAGFFLLAIGVFLTFLAFVTCALAVLRDLDSKRDGDAAHFRTTPPPEKPSRTE